MSLSQSSKHTGDDLAQAHVAVHSLGVNGIGLVGRSQEGISFGEVSGQRFFSRRDCGVEVIVRTDATGLCSSSRTWDSSREVQRHEGLHSVKCLFHCTHRVRDPRRSLREWGRQVLHTLSVGGLALDCTGEQSAVVSCFVAVDWIRVASLVKDRVFVLVCPIIRSKKKKASPLLIVCSIPYR